jgi:cell volume regulation protein A
VLLAYSGTTELGASGFMAAYLAGLVLGNSTLPHRRSVLGFTSSLALLAEVGLYVLLGLLASPQRLPSAVPEALLVGLVLIVVARPLAVLVCAAPFRIRWQEQAFLSWAGLRGAVPIVLTTIPITERVPGSEQVLDVVFVLVVLFTLATAPTLPLLARWLGVAERGQAASSRSSRPRWTTCAPTCCACASEPGRGCTASTSRSCACPRRRR